MGDLALIGFAFAFGVGSALLPMFLNAEVYVVGLGALVGSRQLLVVAILSLGVGTVLGKAVVFELARRGTSRLRAVDRKPPRNRVTAWFRRVNDRLLALLDHRYLGAATVFASSAFMVPPLAVVTIMAGASKQPLWLFSIMVFVGRTAQFLVIALVLHGVT